MTQIETKDTDKDQDKMGTGTTEDARPGEKFPGDPKVLDTTETVTQERLRIEDGSD